jgi:hypothetical protein
LLVGLEHRSIGLLYLCPCPCVSVMEGMPELDICRMWLLWLLAVCACVCSVGTMIYVSYVSYIGVVSVVSHYKCVYYICDTCYLYL